MLRLLILGALLSLLPTAGATAQPPASSTQGPATPGPATGGRLRVYLECDCFQEYVRDQLGWVDVVRQPQDADVHVLSSSRETGGSGRELVLRFVGRGRFDATDTELRVGSQADETENARRSQVLRDMTVGLLGYLARESLPAGLDVTVGGADAAQAAAAPLQDPWNLWVFSVSTGTSFEAEEANRELEWDVNATADRVTDEWKISFGGRLDEQRQTFDLDEDDALEVSRTERGFEGFVARGLGPHWSVGLDGEVESSTFDNTRLSADIAPAVEFSIFPYRDYATRQFVVQYSAGIQHAKYTEVTLFDELEETRPRHELSADLNQRQPWGTIEAGIEWSQYLHDAARYRIEVDAELSLRVVRGLSVNVEGNASRIRDQLSLPRRSATPEEVLLQLRQLQSGYELGFSVGVSYSFGSLFNNVVNPRFDN